MVTSRIRRTHKLFLTKIQVTRPVLTDRREKHPAESLVWPVRTYLAEEPVLKNLNPLRSRNPLRNPNRRRSKKVLRKKAPPSRNNERSYPLPEDIRSCFRLPACYWARVYSCLSS